jgi:hypothetical protein
MSHGTEYNRHAQISVLNCHFHHHLVLHYSLAAPFPAFVSRDTVGRIRLSFVSSPIRILHQWRFAILNQFSVLI